MKKTYCRPEIKTEIIRSSDIITISVGDTQSTFKVFSGSQFNS